MRVFACLAWYDEHPDHLYEMARSVSPLCDGIVAVDGAYALFPNGKASSSPEQHDALRGACTDHHMALSLYVPDEPWQGNEVEKRAFMFQYANQNATPMRDWFLIVDGDMLLDEGVDAPKARELLGETTCDVAQVTFGELAYGSTDGTTVSRTHFRSLFRAIPGLTVEGMHWLYVVPCEDGSRRFMWHGVKCVAEPEPAEDLTAQVRLLHRPFIRERERVIARSEYAARSQGAERVPAYGA